MASVLASANEASSSLVPVETRFDRSVRSKLGYATPARMPSTTTTTIVGGIILTVVLSRKSSSLERYLRDNAVALHQEVGRGAGDTVADLADIFGVRAADRPLFARLLRQNRREVLDLIDPEHLDEARTKRFVALVIRMSAASGLHLQSS